MQELAYRVFDCPFPEMIKSMRGSRLLHWALQKKLRPRESIQGIHTLYTNIASQTSYMIVSRLLKLRKNSATFE